MELVRLWLTGDWDPSSLSATAFSVISMPPLGLLTSRAVGEDDPCRPLLLPCEAAAASISSGDSRTRSERRAGPGLNREGRRTGITYAQQIGYGRHRGLLL